VVAFTDIEERRAYEQALHDHDAILQMLAQPVLTTENGIIQYVNAAAGEVLGHASQPVGRVGYWAVHWKHPDGSHYPIESARSGR
jgi:PAS domain-containing protein